MDQYLVTRLEKRVIEDLELDTLLMDDHCRGTPHECVDNMLGEEKNWTMRLEMKATFDSRQTNCSKHSSRLCLKGGWNRTD